MPLQNTQLTVAATGNYAGSATAGGTPALQLAFQQIIGLSGGTGAGQADKLWTSSRTLAASANEDLDLNGAALTDSLGLPLAFARVKGLIVVASAANTNNVVVGGAATNGFITWVGSATDKVQVRPGGILALFAPDATAYAVTASTADLLRVTNGGAGSSVSYDIYVIGSSA